MAGSVGPPLANTGVDRVTARDADADSCSDVVAPLLLWTDEELDALAELGSALSPYVGELGRLWAENLGGDGLRAYGSGPQPVEALAQVNAWLLEGLLLGLRGRQVAAVFQATLDYDLALLRWQTQSDLRSTLAQLYHSLEVCASLVLLRTRETCAGNPRLPLMLSTFSRLALQLGSIVGQAFYQVRSEELRESLRVTASLLESSRELNTRAASLDGVLLQLTQIVNRLVRCDEHLIFLWDQAEGSYVIRIGSGFRPAELARLRGLRFPPETWRSVTGLDGGVGSRVGGDDGDLLTACGAQNHAAAEMTGADGSPLGALVAFRRGKDPFSASEVRILRGVAQNAALAIANALLLEQLGQQAQLREQASGAARDAERLRLGRELHDGVLQDLSAVKLGIEKALKRGTVESLPSVIDATVRTMHEVRRLVDDLRPADLSAASLREAIAGYARVIAGGRGVELKLDLPATIEVPEWATRDVYRIAQEAVANAVRHAGPTTIEIRLLRDGANVILAVRDDGTGFCLDEAVLGGGVLGMRERAAAIGANLAIISAAGAGTLVRLALPCAATPATDALGGDPPGRS